MRIGINLLYLTPSLVGGSQIYSKYLIDALIRVGDHHEFVICLNRDCADFLRPLTESVRTIVCGVRGRNRIRRILYEQLVLPSAVRKLKLDILHTIGETSPLFPGTRTVTTIHGVNYWLCPEFFGLREKLLPRMIIRQGLHSADHVIAVSTFIRDSLVHDIGVDSEKVSAVHYGAPQIFRGRTAGGTYEDVNALKQYGITPPFLLTVASPWPHKNVAGLIAAYRELLKLGPTPDLVIVGHSVAHVPAVARELETIGDTSKVIFTGYCEFEALPLFYRNAAAFLFPSLGEGFGLPIHEAVMFGLPVVCSDAASLPEVCGDAAILADIADAATFAKEIRRVLDDRALAEELGRRGEERVKRFSWEKAAKETLEIYEVVADMRR